MKKKNNKNPEPPVNEWLGLVKDISSVWLTKDLRNDLAKHVQNYLAGREAHFYDVDEFGMDAHLVESLRPLFQFFYHSYWRVDVKGINNIPNKAAALIVANHSGGLPFDGSMLNMAVYNEHPKSRNVRFLVEDFAYHFPFLGTFISRTGGIRACRENAERLLAAGNLISVFPEGLKGIGKLYKDKYKLQRFGRGGYVRIAIKMRTKIIPTAIIGAEETYPIIWKTTVLSKTIGMPYFPVTPTFPLLGLLGMLPLPSKWQIVFGKPIDCKQYKPKDAENDLLIHQINQKVKAQIAKMIKESLW